MRDLAYMLIYQSDYTQAAFSMHTLLTQLYQNILEYLTFCF